MAETAVGVLLNKMETVALAAKKAAALAPNLDWNPWDHPRDPDTGEFVKIGQGVYIFGKAKKAVLNAFQFKITSELKPGDTAFKTKGGTLLIVHADQTGRLYLPSTKSWKPLEKGQTLITKALSGQYEKVGANPGTKVKAGTKIGAAQKVKNPESFMDAGAKSLVTHFKADGVVHTITYGTDIYRLDNVVVLHRPNGDVEYFSNGKQWVPEGGPAELKAWFKEQFLDEQAGDPNNGWEKVSHVSDGWTDAKAAQSQPKAPVEEVKETPPPPTKQYVTTKPNLMGNLKHPFSGEDIEIAEGNQVYKHKKFDSFIVTGPDHPPYFINQKGKHKKANGDPLTPPADTLGLLDKNYDVVWPLDQPTPAPEPEPEPEPEPLEEWEQQLMAPKEPEPPKTMADIVAKSDAAKASAKHDGLIQQAEESPVGTTVHMISDDDGSSLVFEKVSDNGWWNSNEGVVSDYALIENYEEKWSVSHFNAPSVEAVQKQQLKEEIEALGPGALLTVTFKTDTWNNEPHIMKKDDVGIWVSVKDESVTASTYGLLQLIDQGLAAVEIPEPSVILDSPVNVSGIDSPHDDPLPSVPMKKANSHLPFTGFLIKAKQGQQVAIKWTDGSVSTYERLGTDDGLWRALATDAIVPTGDVVADAQSGLVDELWVPENQDPHLKKVSPQEAIAFIDLVEGPGWQVVIENDAAGSSGLYVKTDQGNGTYWAAKTGTWKGANIASDVLKGYLNEPGTEAKIGGEPGPSPSTTTTSLDPAEDTPVEHYSLADPLPVAISSGAISKPMKNVPFDDYKKYVDSASPGDQVILTTSAGTFLYTYKQSAQDGLVWELWQENGPSYTNYLTSQMKMGAPAADDTVRMIPVEGWLKQKNEPSKPIAKKAAAAPKKAPEFDLNAPDAETKPSADLHPTITQHAKSSDTEEFIYGHPVSGHLWPLPPGATVHQHKKSPNSFILMEVPDGPIFFDKNGKAKPPPAHVFKKLHENFEVVFEAPAEEKVEQPTVIAPKTLKGKPGAKKFVIQQSEVGSTFTINFSSGRKRVYTKISEAQWDSILYDEDGVEVEGSAGTAYSSDIKWAIDGAPKDSTYTYAIPASALEAEKKVKAAQAAKDWVVDAFAGDVFKIESEHGVVEYTKTANGAGAYNEWENTANPAEPTLMQHSLISLIDSQTSQDVDFLYEPHPKHEVGPPEPFVPGPKKTKPEHTFATPWGVMMDVLPGQTLVRWKTKKSETDVYTLFTIGGDPRWSKTWTEDGAFAGRVKHNRDEFLQALADGTIGADPDQFGSETFAVVIDRRDEKYTPDDFDPQPSEPKDKSFSNATRYTLQIERSVAALFGSEMVHGWTNESRQVLPVWHDDQLVESWDNLSNVEKVRLLSTLAESAYAAEAAVRSVREWDSISDQKTEKARLTREANRYALLAAFSEYAQEVLNPDADPKWLKQRRKYLNEKNNGQNWGKDWIVNETMANTWFQTIEAAKADIEFAHTVENLGFDVLDPDPKALDEYAKSKGFEHVLLLDSEWQKKWLWVDVGKPGLPYGTEDEVAAKVSQIKADIAANAMLQALQHKTKKALAKKPKKKPSIDPADRIVPFPMIRELQSEYEWGSETLRFIAPDQWEHKSPAGDLDTLSDQDAYRLVEAKKDDETAKTSGMRAYGQFSASEAMTYYQNAYDAHFDLQAWMSDAAQSQLKKIMAGEGASFIDKMGHHQRWLWMRLHLQGDQVGKFKVEHMAAEAHGETHPLQQVHPGSWSSPTGKTAIAALGAWVAGQAQGPGDWPEKVLGGEVAWSTTSRVKLFEALLPLPQDPMQWASGANTPGYEARQASIEWLSVHASPEQISLLNSPQLANGGGYTDTPIDGYKPFHVSTDTWEQAKNLSGLDSGDLISNEVKSLTEEDLDLTLNSQAAVTGSGVTSLNLGGVPRDVKEWLLWYSGSPFSKGITPKSDTGKEVRDLRDSLLALIKGGHYLDEKTPVWIGPGDTKYPISPGSQVWKTSDDSGWFITTPVKTGESPTGGTHVSMTGQAKAVSTTWVTANLTGASSWEHLFTMPGSLNYADAKAQSPGLLESSWKIVEEFEAGNFGPGYNPIDLAGVDLLYAIKHETIAPGHLSEWPALESNIHHLPEPLQKWVHATAGSTKPGLTQKNSAILDVLDFKAQHGHFISAQAQPLFDSTSPYIEHISKGQFSADDIQNHWSVAAVNSFVEQYDLGGPEDIPARLHLLLKGHDAPDQVEGVLPAELQLKQINKNLGGFHTKSFWMDQNNNEWMTKPFASDPNGKARVDAEHMGNVIGRSLGFRQPETRVMVIDGTYTYVQHLAPALDAENGLLGVGPLDLTPMQLRQAMEEHVLDWVISNHDSHAKNLLQAPDGTIFGIDKGQAFKHFPNDKLAHGYLPPENGDAVWYDRFYSMLKAGQIDEELANEVTESVLRKALRVSKRDPEEHRKHAAFAMQHRQNFPNGMTREQFVDALVERKQSTFDDFFEFYKDLYADSPYEFTFDKEQLAKSKIGDHVHISVTQELADEVVASRSHGKALFVNSKSIEDAHMMLATRKMGASRTLTGEMKLRQDADLVLVEWLKQQTIEGGDLLSGQATPAPVTPAAPPKPSYSALPYIDTIFSHLITAAKTVNHHQEDGGYNQNSLTNGQQAADAANALLDALAEYEKTQPVLPMQDVEVDVPSGIFSGGKAKVSLMTAEQTDAWRDALKLAVMDWEKIDQARQSQLKVPKPNIAAPTYVPNQSDFFNSTGFPKPSHMYEGPDGKVWTLYDDGGVTVQVPDTDDPVKSDLKMFQSEFGQGGPTWKELDLPAEETDEEEPDVEEEETEGVQVQLGVVPTTITKKKFKIDKGRLDAKTGELIDLGEEEHAGASGYMYEIDFGKTRIQYMPWGDVGSNQSADGVPRSQQGLLRFDRTDWDGDAAAIEEVLGVIQSMGTGGAGIQIEEADEESLELYYWRHLLGIIGDRADGSKTGGRFYKIIERVQAEFAAKPDMNPTEELEMLRAAWAQEIGEDAVKNARYLPQFDFGSPHAAVEGVSSGRPWWWHPEAVSYADLRKWMSGSTLVSSLSDGDDSALAIATSGAGLSTEERLRVLGQWIGGTSSPDDQKYGSSTFVFTRQGQAAGSQYQARYHPAAMLRSHTYAFTTDHYGKMWEKKDYSYFDVEQRTKSLNSDNETQVKNAIGVYDAMVGLRFNSQTKRDEAVQFWKDLGVTHLAGGVIPIEDFFTMSNAQLDENLSKVWDRLIEDEKAAKKK